MAPGTLFHEKSGLAKGPLLPLGLSRMAVPGGVSFTPGAGVVVRIGAVGLNFGSAGRVRVGMAEAGPLGVFVLAGAVVVAFACAVGVDVTVACRVAVLTVDCICTIPALPPTKTDTPLNVASVCRGTLLFNSSLVLVNFANGLNRIVNRVKPPFG